MTATNGTLPHSVDLTHHLSLLAKSRQASPLKDIIKYMAEPGMISLAGGLPHPSFFPFTSLSASAYPSSTVLNTSSPSPPTTSLVPLSIPRDPSPETPYNLTALLQYSNPAGHPPLLKFARELTEYLHKPAYSDYTVLLNNGSTDGWSKVCSMVLEPGSFILVEEQIYPSAQAAFIPLGCKGVVISVDSQGALPESLEEVLGGWDEVKRGGKRPHLIYLIPVGQNPLGTVMGTKRRKEIYDICVKYDIVIIEDDPYTMLQFTPYVPGAKSLPAEEKPYVAEFVNSIEKSFLSIDYQGRVIRLDTVSKTIAPGARLGWFVCNSTFAERLLRGTEVQTQHPSGFSQMVIGELFNKWGIQGFLEWCTNIKEQYRVRRDWMLDSLSLYFDVVPASESTLPNALGYVAYPKGTSKTGGPPLLSFVAPTGGMFIWCKVYYISNSSFQTLMSSASPDVDVESEFERTYWGVLADAKVLVTPGWYYKPWMGSEYVSTASRGGERGVGHLRLAFSFEGKNEMEEGIRRLAEVTTREWTK